jgi:molybdopterin-binding protein
MTYTVGQAAEILSVSPDTVRRLADRGDLPAIRTSAGRRQFDGAELARFAASLRKTDKHDRLESARNHFPGLVTKVTKDKVMAQVEMQSGPFRVVSLMSREAADELGLVPGSAVVASVKSTNVVVEALPS